MPVGPKHLVIETAVGPGWISLDRPPHATGVLALTHGARGGVASKDVLAIRDAVVAAGVAVALITQPYRVADRVAPPRPPAQDPPWLELIAALRRRRGFGGLPLVTGGRSNGARVACRTATASGAAAVVALAFPLHPPGKPETSRLPELEMPTVPVLVVQGDRDPFGIPSSRPGREVVVLPGADHALRKDVTSVADAVVSFLIAQGIAR
jgi:predicted alpha/beta-hydrolase family hydrolase